MKEMTTRKLLGCFQRFTANGAVVIKLDNVFIRGISISGFKKGGVTIKAGLFGHPGKKNKISTECAYKGGPF